MLGITPQRLQLSNWGVLPGFPLHCRPMVVSAAHCCCVQAQRAYKQILELYPHSAKLLRSYGRFMQGVKGNPNASMRYFTEADRLDAQQQEVGEGPSLSHRAISAICRLLAPVAPCCLSVALSSSVSSIWRATRVAALPAGSGLREADWTGSALIIRQPA